MVTGRVITSDNGHQLYIPIGFAHGFVTLEPEIEIVYKCTDYYAPETEGTIVDSCGIDCLFQCHPILSDKDNAPSISEFDTFIFGKNS